MMGKEAKIYIAGHRGMVGSALVRALTKSGYTNLVYKTRDELNLLDQHAVATFFSEEKPEYVFLAAAKVGGILANSTSPANFLYENLQIQNNIIHYSYVNNVKKLLFLGSSCIYPKLAQQPMKEEYLLTGPLESTNESYAIAKIAGIKMCQSYNRQYSTNYIAVMPTNLYGPNDNFDLATSHVLPAMIRKFHDAKVRDEQVVLWGTGEPRREFLHVDDMADGSIFVMNTFDPTPEENDAGAMFLNIGVGTDITIKELANLVQNTIGYDGNVEWDATKPNGTPQKLLDISRLTALGWEHKINLQDGIKNTYEKYLVSLE